MPNKWGLNLLKLNEGGCQVNDFLNFAAWNRSIRLQKRIPQRSSHKASCEHKLLQNYPTWSCHPKASDILHTKTQKRTPKKETYATQIKKGVLPRVLTTFPTLAHDFGKFPCCIDSSFFPSVFWDLSGHLHGFQDGHEPSKIPAVGTWWLSISSINIKAYRHRPRRSQALTLKNIPVAMREYGCSLLLYTFKKRHEGTTKAHRNGPRCLPAILAQL